MALPDETYEKGFHWNVAEIGQSWTKYHWLNKELLQAHTSTPLANTRVKQQKQHDQDENQIYVMNMSAKSAYQMFKDCDANDNISFSTFSQSRPNNFLQVAQKHI